MMFYCLAKYPQAYEKVKTEIDQNIDSLENAEYEVFKNKLTYSSAFLNEVLRLFPPLPAITMRCATETFKI